MKLRSSVNDKKHRSFLSCIATIKRNRLAQLFEWLKQAYLGTLK